MKRDRILLSDSPVMTSLLQKAVFRRKNCRFFLAADGEQAWALIEKECPDIIFLDLDLPGMDEVLCRRIRNDSRFRTIPIVAVVSGRREDVRRFRQAGCDDVLLRPLSRHRSMWLMRRLLGLPLRDQFRLEARFCIRYGTGPAEIFTAHTANLGTGGVLIQAPQPLPIGTSIFLELFLPLPAPAIRCRGRIAWVGDIPDEEGECREMGVEFLALPSEDKDLIHRFIERDGFRVPA